MTIEKTDGVWAETGEKESTLTDEKKAAGFVGGDQPTIERMNYLLNRLDEKVDRITVERLNSFYSEAADHQGMISTGQWNESWALTTDTVNTISGGGTKEYRDLAVIFDADDNPQLLVLDDANVKIEVWDARTLTLTDTSDALTDDLPSGGGQTWEAYSMCTDGTYVYVMFRDTNASPDTHQIQAWLISDWTVRSGWAATGTALPGTGNGPRPATHRTDGKIIIADSPATKLATTNGWTVISAASDPAISIIDITDGTIDASGSGDASTGASAQTTAGICSDGTNIFFGTYSPTVKEVCSATIANPQVGCGGSNYPLDLNADSSGVVIELVACGPNMMMSIDIGTATNNFIRTHNSSDADLDIINEGQDSQAAPLAGGEYLLKEVMDAKFDGLNAWVYAGIDNSTGNYQSILLRIDAARLSLIDVDKERQISDVITGAWIVDPENANAGTTQQGFMKCVFDGRDVWVITEPRASQTNSGKLFRLPLAVVR